VTFQLLTSALCLKLSLDFVFRSFFVSSLSRLFATALPLLEASYAYGCSVRGALRKDDSLNDVRRNIYGRDMYGDIYGLGLVTKTGAEADAEYKRRINEFLGPLEEDRCV
jgi:hypothetical protein